MEEHVLESQKQAHVSPEDKAIDPVLEEKQPVLEKTKEEKQPEITVEKNKELALQTDNAGESQINSSKKTKQNVRTKQVTVPQPFSLATEKRMGRERRGSVELPSVAAKHKLGKSASLSYRTQPSSERVAEISQPIDASARTSTKLKAPKNHIQAEKKTNKLENSSTFKASPLPSFYSRKAPAPKPELKKAPVTQTKPPSLSQRSKAVMSTANNKVGDKGKVSSKPISSNTKDKMNKMLTTTPKTFNVSKQTVETIVSRA